MSEKSTPTPLQRKSRFHKALNKVVMAALRESRADLAREGPFEWTGTEAQRMRKLAGFRAQSAARRLRACAAYLEAL